MMAKSKVKETFTYRAMRDIVERASKKARKDENKTVSLKIEEFLLAYAPPKKREPKRIKSLANDNL